MRLEAVAVSILLAVLGVSSLPVQSAEVRVFAAASLTDCLRELAVDYEKRSGDKLIFNFGASSVLARQIEADAPADVFFSADEATMDQLASRGLVLPETRGTPVSNSLVLIVAREQGEAVRSSADLAAARVKRIALADPRSVPAGVYARQYLEKLGIWKAVAPKVVSMDNVRAALAAVESGDADASIVYRTDAQISRKVKVAFSVPPGEGPPIRYSVAVLKASTRVGPASRWVKFLGGPDAAVVFRKHGFLLPDPSETVRERP